METQNPSGVDLKGRQWHLVPPSTQSETVTKTRPDQQSL